MAKMSGMNIERLEKKINDYRQQLAELTQKYHAFELPPEYYEIQRNRQSVEKQWREQLTKLVRRKADDRVNETVNANKTNADGEATSRYITSATYERAIKRTQIDVEAFLGIK